MVEPKVVEERIRAAVPDAETIAWDFYYDPYAFTSAPAPEWLVARIEPQLHDSLVHQARDRVDRTQASFRLLADDIHADRNLFYHLAGFRQTRNTQHKMNSMNPMNSINSRNLYDVGDPSRGNHQDLPIRLEGKEQEVGP